VASERRLAAIMFADMAGYTAAMQRDEAGTLNLLKEQEELVRPILAMHKGREVKSTGDGFLAEFDSALRAVQCAIDIQQHLQERNERLDLAPIPLRIGVHLGDVEQRGTDIFGDAVNIAARVEPLAPPGGVCITGQIYDQVQNKLPNRFEKLGPQTLKNVRSPVEIYRVILPWNSPGAPMASVAQNRLAVLPFSSISPDAKDEYFAEGLTEELITVISQIGGLQVIARTSVMPYKSSSKSVAQIGSELGVSSVLEGSVRKAGNRLRITAQLINAGSEAHVWAKSYDRELDDVFVVQSDIAKQVAEALEVELRPAPAKRRDARTAVRTDSYLAYLKGRALRMLYTDAGRAAAKEQFELAISLDPQNAAAYCGLADVTRVSGQSPTTGRPRGEWDAATRQLVDKALELDPELAEAHRSLALVLAEDYEYVAAEREFQRALSINPSDSATHQWYGDLLLDEGRIDEALTQRRLAEAVDPQGTAILAEQTILLTWLGRRDEARVCLEKLRKLSPDGELYLSARAWYAAAGADRAAAKEALEASLETIPTGRWKEGVRAWGWTMLGESERARAYLKVELTQPELPQMAWGWAVVYGQLGDVDAAFHWLNKAVDQHMVNIQMFRYWTYLKPVREDPRFPAVLKRMNLS
jgi:adenylate cyclase